MKLTRRSLLWLLPIVLVVGAVSWPRSTPVETVTVVKKALRQTVVATGRVNTTARIDIGAQTTGTLHSVLVREGDRVRAGDVVVRLRDDEAQASLHQARAVLDEAQAKLVQIERVGRPVATLTVTQAEAALVLAQTDHQRTQELVTKGFYAQARLDEAQRSLVNARSALDIARAQAAAQQDSGIETQLAHTRLIQAQAGLTAAQARLDNQVVRAPADGVILTRSAEPGSIAQPGRVLLTMSAAGETRIDVSLDEKNLRFLRIGAQASVVSDAFPGERFTALVNYIAPAVDANRGTVDVRLHVDQAPAYLRPDMTVSVEMLVGERSAALVVASDAIRDADTPQPYAFVVRNDRAERVAITLGLRGVGESEVTSGLAEHDALIIGAVDVGKRLRAVERKPVKAAL